jgi:MinD-like ATPase involved in chromosome partitioning or flagellar assembly
VEANQNAISAQERRALKHQKGLADLLANPELTVKSVAARAFGRDLWLLAGGFPLSAGSLQDGYEQLSDRMRELRACFDYILIDAPPLGTSRAPIVLAQLADAAVLVLPASGAHRKSICRLKQELEAAGITLLGAALFDKVLSNY